MSRPARAPAPDQAERDAAVRERADVTDCVARLVQLGDVVFTLGAGDITRVGPELLQKLGKREEGRGKR